MVELQEWISEESLIMKRHRLSDFLNFIFYECMRKKGIDYPIGYVRWTEIEDAILLNLVSTKSSFR